MVNSKLLVQIYPWLDLVPPAEREEFPLPLLNEQEMEWIDRKMWEMVKNGMIREEGEELEVLQKLVGEVVEKKIQAAERRLQQLSVFLQHPVVTVKVSNVPVSVKFKWYYPGEDESINLLFDYVVNTKSIPIYLPRLAGAEVLGVRLLIEIPKQYGGGLEERGYMVDLRRTVHLLKPDFLKYDVKPRKRWIPHRRGKVQLLMEIEYINGSKDIVKILEVEIDWIRYGKPLHELVMERVIRWRTAQRLERKYPALADKHLFAVLRVVVKVRGEKPRQGRIVLPMWTMKTAPRELEFGHQRLEVVKVRDVDLRLYEKIGENVVAASLEPFNHKVKAWLVKRNANELNKGYFELAAFDVYAAEVHVPGEQWWIPVKVWVFKPRTPTARLLLESSHHWGEGLGRILVNLKEGEVLRITHVKT